MHLFNLPSDVLTDLLTEWFSIREVALLDSATANTLRRREFCDVISREETAFSGKYEANSGYSKWLQWILLRRIKLRHLSIKSKLDCEMVVDLFKFCGKSVTRLDLLLPAMQCQLFISISQCENLKCLTVQSFSDELFQSLLQGLTNPSLLTEIRLLSCTLTGSAFGCLSDRIKNLSVLSINNCEVIGDISEVEYGFSSLSDFSLSYGSSYLITTILKSSINLKYICLSSCGDISEGLNVLSNHCGSILNISLFNNTCTKEAMMNLISKCPLLTGCKVERCGCDFDSMFISLTGVSPQITTLVLEGVGFSEELFSNFLQNTKSLTYLGLITPSLPYIVPVAIADNCPGLFELDLSCYSLDIQSLVYLSTKSTRLTRLNISHCRSITDNAFMEITNNCKQLKELSVCVKPLTVKSIKWIEGNCNKLTSLELCYRNNEYDAYDFDTDWQTRLSSSRPELNVEVWQY